MNWDSLIWVVLLILVACCILPMFMMGRRQRHGK